MLISGKCKSHIEPGLSNELITCNEWLVDNRLSHLGQTYTTNILFGSRSKLIMKSNLICNGTNIRAKNSVQYISATLDQHLSCDEISRSLVKKPYIHFDYFTRFGILVWISTGKADHSSQNKIICFVLKVDNNSHVGWSSLRSYSGYQSPKELIWYLCQVNRIKFVVTSGDILYHHVNIIAVQVTSNCPIHPRFEF